MRSHSVSSGNDLECEISTKDLFQDIGSIIVEGRIPEYSKTGRRFGSHSWPVTNSVKKKCCLQENPHELCNIVSQTRSRVSQIFDERIPLKIELYCSIDEPGSNRMLDKEKFRIKINKFCTSNAVLLERWEINLIEKRLLLNDCVNINMMLQAVRSYLHFSQLSSWWNVSQGVHPLYVFYKISSSFSDKSFLLPEETHKFPMTQVSSKEYVTISLQSLPRISKDDFTQLVKSKFYSSSSVKNNLAYLNNDISNSESSLDFHKQYNLIGETCGLKRKDHCIDACFSQHMRQSNCQTSNYVGEKLLRLSSSKFTDISVKTNSDISAKTNLLDSQNSQADNLKLKEHFHNDDSSNNSFLETVRDKNAKNGIGKTFCKKDGTTESKSALSDLLEDFSIGSHKQSLHSIKKCLKCMKTICDCDMFDRGDITPEKQNTTTTQPQLFRIRSKSTSPSFANRQQQKFYGKPSCVAKPVAVRRLAMVAGTVPIFHPKTGLPISSSPAPLKKPSNGISQAENSLSRSGSSEDISSLMLSKSAPASTGLLGNFEESVLQARMPVDGTLQGFRAELGASGSFCPKHVSLPVRVQYFDFFDSSTLSPYLGHIYFSDKKLKRKRYRIPDKGTIQLTIFNPNKTVVKFFVVLYNFSDMPSLTKTFLRQKIVSTRQNPVTMEEIQTIHYLVHLSFVSSKNRHVYLHTEIRVIFPQQAPDGRLITITDGPTYPKYTSIAQKDESFYSDGIEI